MIAAGITGGATVIAFEALHKKIQRTESYFSWEGSRDIFQRKRGIDVEIERERERRARNCSTLYSSVL
jgi:hypothetical protein